MKPYSLAVTLFRIVAVLCILRSVYDACFFAFYLVMASKEANWFFGSFIGMSISGSVLHALAPLVAKAAVWKLKE